MSYPYDRDRDRDREDDNPYVDEDEIRASTEEMRRVWEYAQQHGYGRRLQPYHHDHEHEHQHHHQQQSPQRHHNDSGHYPERQHHGQEEQQRGHELESHHYYDPEAEQHSQHQAHAQQHYSHSVQSHSQAFNHSRSYSPSIVPSNAYPQQTHSHAHSHSHSHHSHSHHSQSPRSAPRSHRPHQLSRSQSHDHPHAHEHDHDHDRHDDDHAHSQSQLRDVYWHDAQRQHPHPHPHQHQHQQQHQRKHHSPNGHSTHRSHATVHVSRLSRGSGHGVSHSSSHGLPSHTHSHTHTHSHSHTHRQGQEKHGYGHYMDSRHGYGSYDNGDYRNHGNDINYSNGDERHSRHSRYRHGRQSRYRHGSGGSMSSSPWKLNRHAPEFVPLDKNNENYDENDVLAMEEGFVLGNAVDNDYEEMCLQMLQIYGYDQVFNEHNPTFFTTTHWNNYNTNHNIGYYNNNNNNNNNNRSRRNNGSHKNRSNRNNGNRRNKRNNQKNNNKSNKPGKSGKNDKNGKAGSPDDDESENESEIGELLPPFSFDETKGKPDPLTKEDCSKLTSKSVLWIIDNDGVSWTFNYFNAVDSVNNKLYVKGTMGEINQIDLDNLPLIYVQPVPKNDDSSEISKPVAKKKTTLVGPEYENIEGRMIAIDTEDVGFLTAKVVKYDKETSLCTVIEGQGFKRTLRLDQFAHEIKHVTGNRLNPGSSKLPIVDHFGGGADIDGISDEELAVGASMNDVIDNNEITIVRRLDADGNVERRVFGNVYKLPGVDSDDLIDLWSHGTMNAVFSGRMEWDYYKNSFLKCLSVGSSDTKYTNLDYNDLMVVSGVGLSVFWSNFVDIDDLAYDSGYVGMNNFNNKELIEEHNKLFMCDSQFGDILDRVSKHSGYGIWMLACKPALNPESQKRNESINRIEKIVINGLNSNIAAITHDGLGHCALIVGYAKKPSKYLRSKECTNKPTITTTTDHDTEDTKNNGDDDDNNENGNNGEKNESKEEIEELETEHFFKIKKMVCQKENEEYFNSLKDDKHVNPVEYETIDLSNQSYVIILTTPQVDEPSHLIDNMKIGMIRDSLVEFSNQYKTGSNIFSSNSPRSPRAPYSPSNLNIADNEMTENPPKETKKETKTETEQQEKEKAKAKAQEQTQEQAQAEAETETNADTTASANGAPSEENTQENTQDKAPSGDNDEKINGEDLNESQFVGGDLTGRDAINAIIRDIKESIMHEKNEISAARMDEENANNEMDVEFVRTDQLLGRMVVYALIRFFDSRQTIRLFFDKFFCLDKEIEKVQGGLREYVADIKGYISTELKMCESRGGIIFEKYVKNYNGKALPLEMKEWTNVIPNSDDEDSKNDNTTGENEDADDDDDDDDEDDDEKIGNKDKICRLFKKLLKYEEKIFGVCDNISRLLSDHIEAKGKQ